MLGRKRHSKWGNGDDLHIIIKRISISHDDFNDKKAIKILCQPCKSNM